MIMRVLLIMLTAAAPALAGEAEKVFEQVRASVVTIATLDERDQVDGEGSGVVVGPGQVVTNCHVVQDAVGLRVSSGDKALPATVISGNSGRDLCRLAVKELAAPAVRLRISSELTVGEPVYIVGNPLGFGLAAGNGIVSALKRSGDDIRIYTSAPTSPGSSGGGLFDAQGRLIGITTARYLGAQNFNMALPSEWITDLLKNDTPWKAPLKAEPDPDWLDRAESLRVAGDWVNMEQWARRWREFWPTSALADTFLGQSLSNQSKSEQALTVLSDAVRKDPHYAAAFGYRAVVRHKLGDVKGALEDLQRARELQPASGYFCRVQAGWFQQNKDFVAAGAAAETAVRLEPWDWESWEVLGEVRQNQRRYQDAEQAYRTVLRLKPDHATASANLASILVALGKPDAARQALARVEPADAGHAAETWARIGTTEGKAQRFTESELAYRKALDLNPDHAEAWMGLGTTLRATGRSDEAEKALRKAVKLNPRLAGAWVNLGAILAERGEKSEARDAYEKATNADRSLAPAWFALGGLYYEQRNMAAAAEALTEATRFDPANAEAWGYLGAVLVRTGQSGKGIDALRKAESLNPKSDMALQGLIIYYGQRGEHERSLEYAERGVGINAASSVFWSGKGYALLKLNRYPEAVQALETAIRLQPDFANPWINLGEAHLRQKQVGKAIVALDKALQLSPQAVDARLLIVQSYALTRQFDKAQTHMDLLLQQAPKLPAAWSLQTVLFLEQQKKLDALSAYGRLKELNPSLARDLRERFRTRDRQYVLPE